MATAMIRRWTSGAAPMVLLVLLLLVAFYLLGSATENSDLFTDLYGWMLLINLAVLLVLVTLITMNLFRLVRQYRADAPGSRLTVRLVVVFVVLAVLPVTVVYYFSMSFLQRGVDSWFDVRIERAMVDALELSQVSLDLRKRELLKATNEMARALADVRAASAGLALSDLLEEGQAAELSLVANDKRIIAFSSADAAVIVPHRLSDDAFVQLRQGSHYLALEPLHETGIYVRVAVAVPVGAGSSMERYLQALYPLDKRLNSLAGSVQDYYTLYKQLSYLREPLKSSFLFTLSLVLILSLFAAVWVAFFSARRLVAPISDLAEGTRAVAAGEYNTQLSVTSHDELGFLVRSFNEMTRKIAQASDDARMSRQQVEDQRAYLEAVLAHLSSGVITLDAEQTVRTVNEAAVQILQLPAPRDYAGHRLGELLATHPYLKRFGELIEPHLGSGRREWSEEVTLFTPAGRQVLMCRGTSLPGLRPGGGDYVVVFDDITALVQAQRDAAWGEVARRLAHEIKNPLTPIQLSAERLRRKYLQKMNAEDAAVLDRSTHTIVQQVEAMKEMVNAFTEYARSPQVRLETLNLNDVIRDVLDLYQADTRAEIVARLDRRAPLVHGDSVRLRQLLHNLVKNGLESSTGPAARIEVSTECLARSGSRLVELQVCDNGVGFPAETTGQYFEPYVTTKEKGTGLGLAIVKKIAEEHGGMVWADNIEPHGARVVVHLPLITREEAREGARERRKTSERAGS